jgi:hypothetical protein
MFAAMLLTVCIGAPVLEMCDHWDHTLQDGNDTESNLVVAVLCVGVGFVTAAAMIQRVRAPQRSAIFTTARRAVASFVDIPLVLPIPHASPPTVLRV